jgi:hypothetical protein
VYCERKLVGRRSCRHRRLLTAAATGCSAWVSAQHARGIFPRTTDRSVVDKPTVWVPGRARSCAPSVAAHPPGPPCAYHLRPGGRGTRGRRTRVIKPIDPVGPVVDADVLPPIVLPTLAPWPNSGPAADSRSISTLGRCVHRGRSPKSLEHTSFSAHAMDTFPGTVGTTRSQYDDASRRVMCHGMKEGIATSLGSCRATPLLERDSVSVASIIPLTARSDLPKGRRMRVGFCRGVCATWANPTAGFTWPGFTRKDSCPRMVSPTIPSTTFVPGRGEPPHGLDFSSCTFPAGADSACRVRHQVAANRRHRSCWPPTRVSAQLASTSWRMKPRPSRRRRPSDRRCVAVPNSATRSLPCPLAGNARTS